MRGSRPGKLSAVRKGRLASLQTSSSPDALLRRKRWDRRFLVITDLAAVGARVVRAVNGALEVDRYVRVARQERDRDLGNSLRELERVDEVVLEIVEPMDADVVIERTDLGDESVLGNGRRVHPGAQEIDLDEVYLALKHLALLANPMTWPCFRPSPAANSRQPDSATAIWLTCSSPKLGAPHPKSDAASALASADSFGYFAPTASSARSQRPIAIASPNAANS
jgi:hypothetical protein